MKHFLCWFEAAENESAGGIIAAGCVRGVGMLTRR